MFSNVKGYFVACEQRPECSVRQADEFASKLTSGLRDFLKKSSKTFIALRGSRPLSKWDSKGTMFLWWGLGRSPIIDAPQAQLSHLYRTEFTVGFALAALDALFRVDAVGRFERARDRTDRTFLRTERTALALFRVDAVFQQCGTRT